MNGRYLLDTNAMIALIRGDSSMQELVANANAILVPCPVLGELYFGAFRSVRMQENVKNVDDILNWYDVLQIDEKTARIYGRLRQQLGAAGRPIPNNDLWIAAQAHQHDLSIVTRDAHFDALESISVTRW